LASRKIRLDALLVELGFFESGEKARTCIMSNGVSIAGTPMIKPGKAINADKFYEELEKNSEYISVEDKMALFVSRGAFKLKAAAETFKIDFQDKLVLDIGASTGGFTDFALQHGAKQVIALDVGKGQLHYKLQQDPRVINLEETNFRDWSGVIASPEGDWQSIPEVDIVVTDVSFISLIKILEKLKSLCHSEQSEESNAESSAEISPLDSSPLNDKLEIIALIKPQFEAGKEIMDKCQGVIRDEKIREEILDRTLIKIEELGYKKQGLIDSPIKGAKGNHEYLAYYKC